MIGKRAVAIALALGALGIGVVPNEAHADGVDEAFARGQRLAKEGQIADAEAAFEQAWAGRKSWDIAGNLGLTEAELGKWEEAAEHLDYAVTHIGGLATPTQKKALTERYEQAKSNVGTVQVASPRVVNVKVGSRVLRSDVPFFLAPGAHKLECSEEGYESTTMDVVVEAGRLAKVLIELKKVAAGPDGTKIPLPIKPQAEPRPSWPGWLLGGVGLAAAGVGAGLLGVGQSGLADAETTGASISTAGGKCTASGGGSPQCADLADDLDSAASLSTGGVVMLIAGGALLIGGVIYLVIPNEPDAPTVSIAPWVAPGSAGLLMQGVY